MADTVAMDRLPAIEHASRTDPGRDPDKQVNEDACGYRATRHGHLAVVCDGMGGHLHGKEASEAALAAIFEVFDGAADDAPPRDVLARAIERANERVFALAPPDWPSTRPGSTVVAALVHRGGTEVAHVGDSRCYLVHAGAIRALTTDHSIVQQLVARGVLTAEQAKKHPDANRITRALGSHDTVEVELAPTYEHVAGDVLVLCSDGLSDLVEPEDVLRLATGPAAQAAGQLVDLANARGGHDNITAVLVRARESAAAGGVVAAAGVPPTVVETAVPALPLRHRTIPPARRSLALVVGLGLAAFGVAAAVTALVAGTRTHRRHGAFDGAAPRERDAQAAPPPTAPDQPTGTEELPGLHHPDGPLRP